MLTSVEEASVPLRAAVSALPAYVPGARVAAGSRAWKLSSNENPYPPLPSVLDAIARGATEVNRYPDMYAGELVEALAAHTGVAPENVVVGNGSVAVLAHVLQAVVEHGDEVVFPWRSFEAYPIAVAVAGGRAVMVPVQEGTGRLDLPAMAAAVTPATRVVLVCTPNNPTGPAVHSDELETFLAAVPRNVLVVVDEAYLEFVRDPQVPDGVDLLRRHPNVVLLRTLSKAYGLAGLRVGYAVAAPGLAAGIRAVSTPFGVSHLAQVAALASLAPEAQGELMQRVDALVAERTRVTDALRDQGWDLPETQANFVWFGLGERTVERAGQARESGVLVRPFAGDGLRVTIGEPEANDAFLSIASTWL
ncbi:histidinol-phosphate transaminase [Promicromonospora thailandica]|uniref:Aromatic amino acid aminotransferase n=1 Tax=Promicromonospora thailandica TaxID=765201 RepID=A0A9X2G482_9MICO|nr:histidinol-phosphate transaminase [Promicromonospora thailandica]MCP2265062.1 histidinol-phosphate aminotransferase [Promicromonospora thailandica]BFF19881.1 histidinol-phosphate transaminase [Promicromonospora thailandica]